MAAGTALSVTEITKRLPLGDRVVQIFQTSAVGTDAENEYINTGFSSVEAVLGYAVLGANGEVITTHAGTVGVGAGFKFNFQGTGASQDALNGALGIAVPDAAANTVQVTVLGRP